MVMKPIVRSAEGASGMPLVAGWMFVFLVWLFGVTMALAAGLEAQVDRTRLAEGESLLLTLSGPGDVWGTPDTGSLARDFGVQNQGQSTSTLMTSGRVTTTREWRFLLTPKTNGHLRIPAIRLGDLESLPIAIEVLPAALAAQVGEAPPARLEAELDREGVYVQGQVIYTLRILLRPQVQNASLEDPKAEGVQIERLGEDQVTEVQRDGLRYRQIERRYALLPQHSGAIEIQAPVLSAAVPESRTTRGQAPGAAPGSPSGSGASAFEQFFGRDPFAEMDSLFQRTRPIQVRGPALPLDVKPQPAGAPDPWLPAEGLQLAESWSPDPAQAQTRLRVGEPITRNIAMTAQGLSATQLPDLIGPVPGGVKSYPDKPRTETRAEGDTLVAVKEIKQALVPTVAGKLVLPEIRLAWWDTQADQERVAVLPARTLEILPAMGAGEAQTPFGHKAEYKAAAELDQTPTSQGSSDTDPTARAGLTPLPAAVTSSLPGASPGTLPEVEPATTPVSDGANPVHGAASSTPASTAHTPSASSTAPLPVPNWPLSGGYWPWLTAAFAILWLTTLLLWWRERRRQSAGRRAKVSRREWSQTSLAAARERVRQACQSQESRATREALIAWGAVRWPEDPPGRLDTLAARLGGKAAFWMGQLDQCLYAPGGGAAAWDGPAAWRDLGPELEVAKRHQGRAGANDPLPPLYPHAVASSG